MHERRIVKGLHAQWAEAFGTLESTLGSFSPEQWKQGASPYTGPGRCAAHALVCGEFYTTGDRAAFDRFGLPVWKMTDDDVPDQAAQNKYLRRVRKMTQAWVDVLAGEGLDSVDEQKTTNLERIIYALRHLQHHTGEMFCWQKQMGIEVTGWE
ncbi:MAG: hypothetical protein ACLFUJ_14345 [Phycisphaerae bacterium]